jgi:ATP-dependent DNA helicase UvrD/PcrA
MKRSHLDQLNPQQRTAVEHGVTAGTGPLLIIAGAGSGKTSTLAHRVAHLISTGADPARILLMTFSRRAAGEMSRRAERIVAGAAAARARPPRLTWAGTFHSIAARLLRHHAVRIGLDPTFTIHDRSDAADLMNLVRHELGFSQTERRFPAKATCLSIYSRAVNAEMKLDAVLARTYPWCSEWEAELRALFADYVAAKQRQHVLDYDDLLLYWAQLMTEPALAGEVAGRFDHVLVDEYQDTNRLQASILFALRPGGSGLTVVGDDAQSIYSFRAATVRNILDFPGRFTPPARVVTLDRNYRSTQSILAAANGVIALAAERFTKHMWSDRPSAERPRLVTVADESEQARYVIERVLDHREGGIMLKSQAVLFRTSHHSGALELELIRRNIPFVKFGGLKFLEAAHIKDVLSFLRWVENPRDRLAGFRLLQLLPGIGPSGAADVLDRTESCGRARALADFAPPARTASEWAEFVNLVGPLAESPPPWPEELAAIRRWYGPHLDRLHDDAPVRMADLIGLEATACTYASRERFLTELTLDPPEATSDEAGSPRLDEDYLVLSTIHSAKGREWSAVFILNAVDGCIPSDLATRSSEEIEEERRLLYVAMTRAKHQLDLILPQRFYTHAQTKQGDRHVYAARTRFIPEGLLPAFELMAWGSQPRDEADEPRGRASPRVDLASRMRAMWR